MNPYEVLGVSENADEETVKKAYKDLVKKYHPDKYVNNPLADLAAEKMKEINKAYDMITKGKTQNQTGSANSYGNRYGNTYGNPYSGYGTYQNAQPTFSMVRQLIQMNRPQQALAVLRSLPKTAEWYYLSGLASIKCGRYNEGLSYMEKAIQMEPNNAEYRDTLNSIRNRGQDYYSGGNMYSGGDTCPLPCYCIPCMCCNPCDGPC